MAEQLQATKGEKKVLYFRLLKERGIKAGKRLPMQTKHTITEDRDVDSTATKDGAVAQGGAYTVTIDLEALDVKNNEIADMLHYAQQENESVEVWEVDFDSKQADGTYPALYSTGLLGSWETEADVEGSSGVKTTITIDGKLKRGFEKISASEVEEVDLYYHLLEGEAGNKGETPKPLYTPTEKKQPTPTPTPDNK